MEGAWEYSQSTAALIDEEVKAILAAQFEQASAILEGKRTVLDKGAKLLLEREKIEGEELKALMGDGKA
jgi:cell division protease FtsH